MTREYRTRDFWQQLVEEFESSEGITHAVFTEQNGVRLATFRKWLYQIRHEPKQEGIESVSAVSPFQFVELIPSPFEPNPRSLDTAFHPSPSLSGGRLFHNSHAVVEFDVLPPAPYLAQLLNLLES